MHYAKKAGGRGYSKPLSTLNSAGSKEHLDWLKINLNV